MGSLKKEGLQYRTIELIREERRRQHMKWGQQDHNDATWLAILVEEVGEVAKAMLEKDLMIGDVEQELVEVAAVAAAWIQSIDRRRRC